MISSERTAFKRHLGGEDVGGVGEFVKGEAGHFGDHVVQRRLKAGGGVGQGNFLQEHTHRDLGRHPGDGIAAGLGGQGGGTGDTGVDLDQVVPEGLRVQRELHVAAALNLEGANQLEGAVAEQMVFLIGQGLAGGHDDGVAGVDANRIDVLHVADGDGSVVGVPHDLIFDFLVAPDALFHQHLTDGGKGEAVFEQLAAFLLVVGKAAAGAAEGESGAQDHRVTDLFRRRKTLFQGVGDDGGQHRLAKTLAQLLEPLAVLGLVNGVGGGAQQLHAALLQNSHPAQLHCEVQAGLSADAGEQRVGPLHSENVGGKFGGQGFHIDLVRNGGVGHDGGRVGVGQKNLVALLLQGQACLGTGVVELGGLPDDNGAGADDQNAADVGSLRHGPSPPSYSPGIGRTDRRCPAGRARSRGGTAPRKYGPLGTRGPRPSRRAD